MTSQLKNSVWHQRLMVSSWLVMPCRVPRPAGNDQRWGQILSLLLCIDSRLPKRGQYRLPRPGLDNGFHEAGKLCEQGFIIALPFFIGQGA